MNVELGLQTVLAISLGIYLLVESVGAILQMSRNEGSLHVTKYVLSALVGMWMCFNAYLAQVDWLMIAQGAALSSFVARRLLWRFGNQNRDSRQTKAEA